MDTDKMNFDQYEADWLKRHKRSLPSKPRVSSWGLVGGILLWSIIALGAALVSGAHSVPAIYQTIPLSVPNVLRTGLSLFGFTIFELLIFAGALYRRDSRFAHFGLLLSMIGALAANVGSSVFAVTENKGDWLNMVVAVVLAFIAPLAAFLAGEMVHRLFAAHNEKMREAGDAYNQARADLDKQINRDFVKYERDFAKAHEVPPLRETFHENFAKSGEASKPRVKIHEVARLVRENGDENLSTDEMMTKYEISLGSTTKIRQMLKSQGGSHNQLLQ